MKSIFRCLVGVVVLLFLLSCTNPFNRDPAVAWSDVHVVVGDRGSLHSVAGIYHSVHNLTDQTIVELIVAFDLYDSAGRPYPEVGGNSFTSRVARELPPGRRVSLCTRLDGVASRDPGAIDVSRFRVLLLRFSDGTEWTNRLGPIGGEL